MLKKIKNLVEKKIKGGQVDINNCWLIDGLSISSQEDFLIFIIEHVPDDSVWAIEGCFDDNMLNELRKYKTEDSVKVFQACISQCTESGWNDPIRAKVLLSKENKPKIIEIIKKHSLCSLIHHHIYYKSIFYFTTYDNFSAYVAVSKKFDNKVMNDYAEKNNIKFIEPTF
ncbi:hypothetical protein KY338_04625 [Candidatus Woesearchaeota archaeon]|nr:hypothetical protein [Candidatus Woesearchaeota archaeon]MBW3005738.1 hypothetical protein [Candidatus Woesearchaeota archaeon]